MIPRFLAGTNRGIKLTSAEMGAYSWGQMERCERADTEMEEGRMQGGARDPQARLPARYQWLCCSAVSTSYLAKGPGMMSPC